MSTDTKITQISTTFPPVFTTSPPNIDPFISSRKNVLSIDLAQLEREALSASQGPVRGSLGHPFRGRPEDLERNTLLIHHIRKLVSEDAAKQPEDRIDCVEIGPNPWPEHLRALDGLSPKHLRVDAGMMEQIDIIELDNRNTKFKLESLWISSVANDQFNSNPPSESPMETTPSEKQSNLDRFPEFFTHVKSLTLEWCCSCYFEGTNLPTHLRQLKIIGNNAMDMFIFAVDHIPNASEQLENVFIYTDPQYDSYAFWVSDFRERLGRCKGMKELTLIVAGDYEARAAGYADMVARYPREPGKPEEEDRSDAPDIALSRSLPNSIERLEFHCSNSEPMLADLDRWIEAAKDSKWLPCLKSIHIRIYDIEADKLRLGEKQTVTVNKERERKISEKIQRVYEVLKKRDPPLEVGH